MNALLLLLIEAPVATAGRAPRDNGTGQNLLAWTAPVTPLYAGSVSNLNEHLPRVQDIATRVAAFRTDEASDPKAFSKSVVEDLGVLAEAVAEIIKQLEA